MLDLIRRLRIPTPSSRLLRDIHGSLPSLLRTEHRLLSLAGSHGLELQPGEDILQVLARYILDTNPGDVCRCEFLKTLRTLVEDMEPEFTQFAEIHLFPLLEGIEQVLDSGDQYRHHIRPADGGLHGYPAAQLLER